MKKIVLILVFILFGKPAFAVIQIPSGSNPYISIIKISTYGDMALLRLDTSHGVCDMSDQITIEWSQDETKKNILSSALTAFAANKRVGLGLEDCSSSGHPLVYRIDVYF